MYDGNNGRATRGPEIDLTQLDDAFSDAPIEERTFEEVPDGKYQVNVDKVEIVRAKTSGNPMLSWTLRIIAPQCVGRLLFRHNVMATRENMKWLKNDLHVCGLVIEKVSELHGRLRELLDVKLDVTKRTRGEHTNIYLNRRIVMDDPGGADDAGYNEAAGDALIPF